MEYFMTTKKLTRNQICWVQYLSKLNIIIFYIMVKNNIKTNIVIWHSNISLPNNYND